MKIVTEAAIAIMANRQTTQTMRISDVAETKLNW